MLLDRGQHALRFASQHVVIGLIDPANRPLGIDEESRRNRQPADASWADIERISQIEQIRHDEIRIGKLRRAQPVLVPARPDLFR
jgi:hypothetical protein